MSGRIAHRVNTALSRHLPEQRLFLKSDSETRFVRLSPMTQAVALGTGGAVVAWTVVASAILMMDSIGAGNAREQTRREQLAYEARLNALSADREKRTEEAASAQARFNVALEQVSQMQSALLASEDRRTELETGINVIQKTLQRTVKERDDARATLAKTKATLVAETGSSHTTAGEARDMAATVTMLSAALSNTAQARDSADNDAEVARQEADKLALDKRLMIERNQQIFGKLENAVQTAMGPLDKMFKRVGISPDKVLADIRRGTQGDEMPAKITLSTSGRQASLETTRANEILASFDQLNRLRIGADKVPLGLPLHVSFRYSSPFGYRHNPFGGSKGEFHPGQDIAAKWGSPLYSTADGVVVRAGWVRGYGKLVEIQHSFGLTTRYGHMSRIAVKVGERVSRGERIGDMGSTGRSTGSHVHYEVRQGDKPVNPMTYIKAAANVF
ncbi:M23 family metallopeptidase [Acidimangrovimonas sediminis]|uniref:M23 family metallopeptidase n=1 Tax=Acidimangrovimonas sediminis TaxID=2056283 RepID=UPI000C80A1CE|nr:M23 family metallopeptidase [Acidimangrovimonas sediminis]